VWPAVTGAARMDGTSRRNAKITRMGFRGFQST
jgi:hypothetical protein